MSYSAKAVGFLLLFCAISTPVLGDELRLVDGEPQDGRLIAVGPTRLVFDGPEGLTFHLRTDVAKVLDADGRVHPLLSSTLGKDPAGVVTTVDGAVRVRRRGQQLKVSIHGSLAILRDDDELRTDPYSRVAFDLPSGGVAVASGDAIVHFMKGTPRLLDGKLRLRHNSGRARALIPEGRLTVSDGETEVQHLRGRSRILCLKGRVTFLAAEGYQIEVPRKHVLEVRSPSGGQPASVLASNTNAWPLRLEYGRRWVSVQPGERVILLGNLRGPKAPPPAPADAPIVRDVTPPQPLASARVIRATASFTLDRKGSPAKRYDQAEAPDLELAAGDTLKTDQGELFLQGSGARLHVMSNSELLVKPPEGGATFKLLSGESSVRTQQQVSIALQGGAIGLLRGEASIRQDKGLTHLALQSGTAGARFGEDVRAELLAPAELDVRIEGATTVLSVPPATQTVPLTLGQLDLQLKPSKSVSYKRVGERRVIALWNGASLQFMDPIRSKVIPGPDGVEFLEFLDDGSRVALRPGTYRFKRVGKAVVADQLPAGVHIERSSSKKALPPPTDLAKRSRAAKGGKRHKLANGAIVITRGWGELKIQRATANNVIVSGLGGEIVLGPRTVSTLSREGNYGRFETKDGRFVRHEQGAGPVEIRLEQDARMRITVDKGTPRRRSIDVESGTEFDLTVRRDRYTLAFVFGQAVYLEPGQRMSVTQASGLRTYMAADRKRE